MNSNASDGSYIDGCELVNNVSTSYGGGYNVTNNVGGVNGGCGGSGVVILKLRLRRTDEE